MINNTAAVTQHATTNSASSSSSTQKGKNNGTKTYPSSGNAPKNAKLQNMTTPSRKLSFTWSSSGSCRFNSSIIMTSMKKSLYRDIVVMHVVASSRVMPRDVYISIISSTSPSG